MVNTSDKRASLMGPDGQGGLLGNIGNAIKKGAQAVGNGAKAVGNAFNTVSAFPGHVYKDIKQSLKDPDLLTNVKAKFVGSSKGERLRQIIKDENNFTPDVMNGELSQIKIRGADAPGVEWSGHYYPKQNEYTGKGVKMGAGDWLTGTEPGIMAINDPNDPGNTGAHELLHKIWDTRVQNQPVGQAFQSHFIDAVKNDPDASEYLKTTGLFGDNDLYGKPTSIDEAPATEVYAYLGQNFSRHPWDMPENLRPYYKGVLNFDASPERKDQIMGQDIRDTMYGMQKDIPYFENLAATEQDPQKKAKAQRIVDYLHKEFPQVQQDNYNYVMTHSGTLQPAQKRSIIQNALQPLDNVVNNITGYFKNF